ncbi:MAG TPA: flagellar hook capping FlgD N-terminal domain-containing protein [Edaphobacter sp.]|nr:flagellar hook capping FlgD N-terminal domain-containing protein [Edaphobacter sp.]
MEGLSSISGAGAAAAKVASALMPKQAARAKAADQAGSGQDNTGAATADNATITANDFLVLLVTELKNQDPTQPIDPNAYIQQLVGVNSLQQLISINKNLTPPSGGTPTSGT